LARDPPARPGTAGFRPSPPRPSAPVPPLAQFCKAGGGSSSVLAREDFSTAAHGSLEEVVGKFIGAYPGVKLAAACFAVAGPVVDGTATMTNVAQWKDVTIGEVQKVLANSGHSAPVGLLNDFEAVGYGIPCVADSDLLAVHDVPRTDKGPIVVIGPGTGLGACQLFWNEAAGGYKVYPGEGTHSDFAPRGDKQKGLLDFVEAELGYCEIEHVGCGAGLERIYRFLGGGAASAKDISAQCAAGDPRATEAMDTMLAIVGQEAGHMAIRCLASGGVYVAGGIVPKNRARVEGGGGTLLEGFLNPRSRLHALHERYALSVVLDESVGLLGAEDFAKRLAAGQ